MSRIQLKPEIQEYLKPYIVDAYACCSDDELDVDALAYMFVGDLEEQQLIAEGTDSITDSVRQYVIEVITDLRKEITNNGENGC